MDDTAMTVPDARPPSSTGALGRAGARQRERRENSTANSWHRILLSGWDAAGWFAVKELQYPAVSGLIRPIVVPTGSGAMNPRPSRILSHHNAHEG
jgi:hypothetical protein